MQPLLLATISLLLSQPNLPALNPFAVTVDVTLSGPAAAKLARLNEGMVVSATWQGDPKPKARKHADQVGRIDLGAERIEVPGRPATVHLTGTPVQRPRLAWTQSPINLNINVYSARHSGPDNILACDFFDGDLEHATAKPVPLHCSLISEQAATRALSELRPPTRP